MTDTLTKTCPACFTAIDANASRCPKCTQRQSDVVLSRDVPGKVLGGVCSALAHHFNWDVTVMRVVFIASLAVTGGLAFWVYVATWLMTPFGRHDRAPLARFFDSVANVFSSPANQPQRVPTETR